MCTAVGNMIRIWVRPSEIPEASVFYKAFAFVPVLGFMFAEVLKASLNEKIAAELRNQQPQQERAINLIKVRKDYCNIGSYNGIISFIHLGVLGKFASAYFSNMVILSSVFSLIIASSMVCLELSNNALYGYKRDSGLITLIRNGGIRRNMDYV